MMYTILSFIYICATFNFGPQNPMTPTQLKVLQNALNPAKQASEAANKTNTALFCSPYLTTHLKALDDGSKLYEIECNTLQEMFWNELSVAELVHSFGDAGAMAPAANCGFDLGIPMGEKADYFYNQWQIQALGLVPVDPAQNVISEAVETSLFKFPPFKNVSQPDPKTSADRPYYAAINMFRGSGGNPQCGPATVVLNPEYIENRILAAPVDTGFWNGVCTNGSQTGSLGKTKVPLCSAWPNTTEGRVLGVPPYTRHLLDVFVRYYNQTQEVIGESYPYYNLARLLIRLLSRKTYALPPKEGTFKPPVHLSFMENTLGYFEFNPVEQIHFPEGVKMIIGMFELLFGTTTGDVLRNWCIERGWALLWAFNPQMSYFRCGPTGNYPGCHVPDDIASGLDAANIRLLDPTVLSRVPAGQNISNSLNSVQDDFETLWRIVNVSNSNHTIVANIWMDTKEKYQHILGVEPLYYNACSSPKCVGVNITDQSCICASS
eukprot:m.17251 g.17251  ORF g.17251 m.17251 type:complete len:492 (-) comp5958_c0_seq2:65-1540(-)